MLPKALALSYLMLRQLSSTHMQQQESCLALKGKFIHGAAGQDLGLARAQPAGMQCCRHLLLRPPRAYIPPHMQTLLLPLNSALPQHAPL